jgi:putative ABC transport system permease protein
MGQISGSQGGTRRQLAYSEFAYLRDHHDVFSGMFAADSAMPNAENILANSANGSGEKQRARIKLVSGGYFTTLGVKPAAGRFFTGEMDRERGGSPVALRYE